MPHHAFSFSGQMKNKAGGVEWFLKYPETAISVFFLLTLLGICLGVGGYESKSGSFLKPCTE
jgi:hypothetical protein